MYCIYHKKRVFTSASYTGNCVLALRGSENIDVALCTPHSRLVFFFFGEVDMSFIILPHTKLGDYFAENPFHVLEKRKKKKKHPY